MVVFLRVGEKYHAEVETVQCLAYPGVGTSKCSVPVWRCGNHCYSLLVMEPLWKGKSRLSSTPDLQCCPVFLVSFFFGGGKSL